MNSQAKQNHILVLIDAKKAFKKIQHLFMIKILRKLGIEGNFFNLIKTICKKPTANIFNGEKLSASHKDWMQGKDVASCHSFSKSYCQVLIKTINEKMR